MTTDTSTTSTTLRLVRVLPDIDDRWRWLTDQGTFPTGDAAIFFANVTDSTYVTLVVPVDDPRHVGMWQIYGAAYNAPQDGKTYHGWTLNKRYVEEIPDAPADPLAELVPGAWFTWGSRVAWYRVGSVDGDTFRADRDKRGDGSTTFPTTGTENNSAASFDRATLTRWAETTGPLVVVPPQTQQEAPQAPAGESPEEAYRRGKREAEEAASRTFEAWKDRAVEIAHQYADDNDLCSQFDRCMEEIGLPTRRRSVEVRVTFNVEIGRHESDRDALSYVIADATGVSRDDVYTLLYPGHADVVVCDENGDEINSW